jgi:hypothetical protein
MQQFSLPSHTSPATCIEPSKEESTPTSTTPDSSLSPNTNTALSPECALAVDPSKTKQGKVSFGEPSVIKPTCSSSPFTDTRPASAFANYSQPTANPFTPKSHLEAFIIRPVMHTTATNSTLSYVDEPLRLSEEIMQVQLRTQRPDYSIMEELLNLHSVQLHVLQRRAAQRHGHIVSVQHGKALVLNTIMGSLEVKPVVCLISTTTAPAQERTGLFHSPAVTDRSALYSGGSGTSNAGKGLFGGVLGNKSARAPASGGSNLHPTTTGLFQNLVPETNVPATSPYPADLPPATGLFQQVSGPLIATYSDFPPGAGSTSRHSSVEAYSRYLHEKGETCTHVEPSECKGEFQHYQTITANKEWHDKDQSLEEIRVADYDAGRTGRSLFGGPTTLSTPAGALKTGWHPEPPRCGTFAGFLVDNSDKAPAFTKPGTCSNSMHANPTLFAFDSNPFGTQVANLKPFVPPNDPQPGAFTPETPATIQSPPKNITRCFATQPSGGLFGGLVSKSNDSHFSSTTNPTVTSTGLSGGPPTLFGGAASAPGQHHSSCLVGWSPLAQAAIPTTSLPTPIQHRDETQTRCALFAQPSNSSPRPGGLFGNLNTNMSKATSGQPTQIIPSASAPSLFGNVNSPTLKPPLASFGQPTESITLASDQRVPKSTSAAPVIGERNTLQEYQRQLRKLEKHIAEARRAEAAAAATTKVPHDAAAPLGSAKSAPIDEVISALLSDDKSEEEKEAWYKAGLATLSGAGNTTTMYKDASSSK